MKKTFKKIVSLVLALVMIMSIGVVGVGAADTDVESEKEEYGSFAAIFIQFWIEVGEFLKYIFYDLWLGKAPV